MQKKLLSSIALLAAALMLAVVAGTAFAGPSAPAGKSNTGQLYLFEKDPATWGVIADGAWGKMQYQQSGSAFDAVFNGHELMADTDYTLIYYPDPWPGNGLICLGDDTANKGGNVHISATVDPGTNLPAAYDANYGDGAKIWLVLSADVDCDNAAMVGWNPEEYLFEADKINFEYAP